MLKVILSKNKIVREIVKKAINDSNDSIEIFITERDYFGKNSFPENHSTTGKVNFYWAPDKMIDGLNLENTLVELRKALELLKSNEVEYKFVRKPFSCLGRTGLFLVVERI